MRLEKSKEISKRKLFPLIYNCFRKKKFSTQNTKFCTFSCVKKLLKEKFSFISI